MEPLHLIAFNLTLLAALASPGPALLVAIRSTITGGSRSGISTGAGLALVASLWTLSALLGLELVFTLFPWAYKGLKLLGATYLIWLAIVAWRHARAPLSEVPVSTRKAFLTGITVNLLNPKSVLFAAALLVVIFPPDMTYAEKFLITANHFAVEFVVYSAIAWLMARPAVRTGYLRAKPIFDRISAFILGGLGLRLLVDR